MDGLNVILAAVSVGLGSFFPNVPVYPELVPEKVPERCFLIGFAGGVEVSPQPHGSRKASGTLDVTYLAPATGTPEVRRELNSVFFTLALELRRVTYEGVDLMLRRHRRTDDGKAGRMQDLIAFSALFFPVDDTPRMNDISIKKEEVK